MCILTPDSNITLYHVLFNRHELFDSNITVYATHLCYLYFGPVCHYMCASLELILKRS